MRGLGRVPALSVLLTLAACGSPIVGAQCRPGFVVCDGRCVKLDDDPQNCGACGYGCGLFECHAGGCSTTLRPDAGAGTDGGPNPSDGGRARDGGSKTGGRTEAGVGKSGAGTPFTPDGGFTFPDTQVGTGCGIGQTACGAACADTRSDPSHCGDCGTSCPSDQFCSKGTCVNICDAPLKLCNGGCVDFDVDETNCGSCGNVCASGICEAGQCADVTPGSLVVIGHDYQGTAPLTMQRIAGNSLFLARGAPVRTLVYTGTATKASVTGVGNAIAAIIAADGRAWDPVAADPDQVSAQLRDVTAFVIHAQSTATDADLVALGQKWGLSLSQFLYRGGVVVLFETASTKNSGTYHVLSPAGLFEADRREAIGAQTLTVVTPGIGVAEHTTSQYKVMASTSVHFLNVQSAGSVVVEDKDKETVVFHRIVSPP